MEPRVKSGEIEDGAIMNVDINASAAIAVSKLAASASTIIGTKSAGGVVALTPTEAKEILSLDNVTNVAQMPSSYLDTDGTLAADSDTKVASQKAVKAYVDANASAADIEVVPLIDPIVNISSQGDTYVDSVGNIYAETANQTRSTMPAVKRKVVFHGNAHVSAGTGTIALYNVTDGTVMGSTTTTSTTRVNVLVDVSPVDTNNGDGVTVKLKNSTAGASITIDHGGFMIVEGSANAVSTVSLAPAITTTARLSKTQLIKLVLMGSHTGTPLITGRLIVLGADGAGSAYSLNITTGELTEANENTVITNTLLYAIPLTVPYRILFNVTSITGLWSIGASLQQNLLYG